MADMRPNYYMYYIAGAVNLGMMFEGMFLAWSSPSLAQLQAVNSPITITTIQSSWITSLLSVGNLTSSILATKTVDIMGRKKTLYLMAVIASISWIITGFATTAQELYAARFFGGVSVGLNWVATMIYLAEVSPANIRGLIGGMMIPCLLLGEICIMTIGSRLTVRTMAWIALFVPLLFIILILPLPESPYFLAMKGRFKEAEKSLRRLRGTTEVAEDLRTLKKTVEINARSKGGLRDLFMRRSNLKLLGIALGVATVQEWCGMIVTVFHPYQILSEIDSSLSADVSVVPPILRIIGSCICALLVDRTGKKPLLIFSASAMAMCTFILALFFSLRSSGYVVEPYSWIPVVAFCTNSAAYSMGLASLPFVIVGELFPLNVKAVANGTYRVLECSYQFIIAKSYMVVSHDFGIQYPFWAFSLCTLAGVFFIKFAVPETTGKTLEEIQEDMQNETAAKHNTLLHVPKSAKTDNAEVSVQETPLC